MSQSSSKRIRRFIVGGCLLILGFIGGFVPVLQGWVFTILALLILKDDIICARRCVVWIYRKFPGARPSFRIAENKMDEWMIKFGLKEDYDVKL